MKQITITKAQIKAIQELTNDCEAMIGSSDRDVIWLKYIKLIDRFLETNNIER